MGADLCIVGIFDLQANKNIEKRLEKMTAYLRKLNKAQIEAFDLKNNYYGDSGTEPPSLWSEMRDDLINTVEEFGNCNGARSTDTFAINNSTTLHMAGGTSYGDSPNETYDSYTRFLNLPEEILKIGGFSSGYLDSFNMFMNEYENKMPKKVKDEILKWKMAEKI